MRFLLAMILIGSIQPLVFAQDDGIEAQVQPAVESRIQPEVVNQLLDDEQWSLKLMRLRDLSVYWDNDGTVPNILDDSDRFYTNGNGIELSFDPNLTEDLEEMLAPAGEWDNPRFGVGIAVKQLIFTGDNIQDPAPAEDDHPYSGYLYFAFSFQRADEDKHDHFELDIGVVGERSQAEAVQRFVHHAFPNQDTPQGWSNQLANELAINFNYERTWKSKRAESVDFDLEMLPSLGFEVGNVSIRGKARLTLRAGKNMPNDFGPATLLGKKDHTLTAADWGKGKWSIYVYATIGIDAIAHTIFLDGNTFATSRSVDSEPFVAQATFGLLSRYKSFHIGWSKTYQSESYETQTDSHTWGSVALGYSYSF
jgi:lipid A 3-O-deacylase